ncbi:MAG: cytidine deaminase [candidate division Zixibacteria bacterium CG_4_9_14_3_um_filter_46_8]|nr:MAG: cytidine deaminase [candidate division Zixibacteria bacterium CG_4_9_14_3_um_filter_46_8]
MEISEIDLQLVKAAFKALENSYSPYSRFKVGAAVRSIDGSVFTGCNVENASYGLTICAERNAVYNMVTEGKSKIEAVAVVVDGGKIVTPCGACRQVIREFADDDCPIICSSGGDFHIFRLGQLLPDSFNPSSLQ